MATKECEASSVALRAAAAPVRCRHAAAWQHVPLTRRLRALAHCSTVGSASGSQASPPSPQQRVHTPNNNQLWTEQVCRRAHPQTTPPCCCSHAQMRTRGAGPGGTLPEDWSPFPGHTHTHTCGSASRPQAPTGGQLQSVLMRPTPQLSVKTCRGGGSWGGGGGRREDGGGVLAARRGGSQEGGGLRATHYYHMHTSTVCVYLGAWGYRGMCALIAISRLCQEESLKGLKDQRHRGGLGGVAYKDRAWPPPPCKHHCRVRGLSAARQAV